MREKQIVNWILVLFASLTSCTLLAAQDPNCAEINAMERMASARSTTSLMEWNRKAGDSYRAKVVFAFRFFELHPADHHAASAILDLIPQNKEQDFVWHSFNEYIECGAGDENATETEKDMRTLGRLGVRLPRGLARAVILVPDKMLAYVSYANTSSGYPDSDYAVQMQGVCRAKHREFVKAVDQLPPADKKWFLSSTFNPDGCHALYFPEQ